MAELPAIVGAWEHPTRKAPDHTPIRLLGESARGALDDAGLTPADIDGLCYVGEPMGANYVTEYLNIRPRWFDSTAVGGSSYLSHIMHASNAIQAGHARAVLIAYGSTARSSAAALGSSPRAPVADPMTVSDADAFDSPYGVILAAQYALVARRHMHEYGTTREQLAEIAVACRKHGALNPNAQLRKPLTLEQYRESRLIAAPLRRDDCCLVSDGAAAVVVMSAQRARQLNLKNAVPILGFGQGQTSWEVAQRVELTTTAAEKSAHTAFKMAGLTPKDIDVAQLYDCFTIAPLMTLEAYGFCPRGKGGQFVQGGRIEMGGELPINTSGGLLSETGMPGLQLVLEGVRQMRGQAVNQVKGARTCAISNQGGIMHTHSTLILGQA